MGPILQNSGRGCKEILSHTASSYLKFSIFRNGHIFIIEALGGNEQICYQNFHMYRAMLIYFAHILSDEYDLSTNMCLPFIQDSPTRINGSSQQIDIYE